MRGTAHAQYDNGDWLSFALGAARLGEWVWDAASDAVELSPRAAAIFGVTSPAAWSDILPLIHPDDMPRVDAALHDSAREHHAGTVEYRLRAGAEERLVTCHLCPKGNADGSKVRVWVLVQDVTRERDTERRLREQTESLERLLEAAQKARASAEEANRLKDEFLSTVSHELRTPLNAILGWARLLQTRRTDINVERALATIERNARSQAHIIEDLLDMSRIVSGKMRLDVQRVDVGAILNAALATVHPAAAAKSIRIDVALDPAADPVAGDPGRLEQVFWNLLSNAIKFTPKGGRVEVDLRRSGSRNQISVTDTGEGISDEFLPHVFDRFKQVDSSTTRQTGGLGLGLAIVQHLVEMHGGTVEAQSDGKGRGASFIVALPVMAAIAPPDPAEARKRRKDDQREPVPSPRLDGIHVLVVDDEADARELLSITLRDAGARVTAVGSADEALAALEAEPADVLISDVGMPGRDGNELVRSVRQQLGNMRLPAVALSASARAEDRREALLSGFHTHLAKPVDPAELVGVVAGLNAIRNELG